jgi:hypothetical protein
MVRDKFFRGGVHDGDCRAYPRFPRTRLRQPSGTDHPGDPGRGMPGEKNPRAAHPGQRPDDICGLPGAYPEIVLIGLLIVLLDLAAIGGLIIAIVMTARQLRPSRLARPGGAIIRRWTRLITLSAALGLLVLGNARILTSGYDQGRPAPAQVAGTWTDSDGATLQVLPDGTFTAAGLPADADDPAGDGKPHPPDGRGTWQITRGDGTWYALFTFSGGSQFRLDALTSASPGHLSTATFSYVFAQYDAVNLWTIYRR